MVDIPGDSSTTQTITVGGAYSGSIEVGGDHDWIAITLTAGQSISIALDGSGASALADPYLRLRDSSGNLLAENDDGGLGTNSLLGFKATYTGVYYIDVSAWEDTTPGATQLTGDYQLRVSPYTPPPLGTVQQIAAQLTNDYWGGSSHHFAATQGGSISVNIGALTPDGQFLAREALRVWSDVIGVSFPEVSSGGQIVFSNDQDGASTGANWSRGIETSAHVNVSTQWLTNYGTTINTYSFQTFIHEIGHALGLGHAGDYNGEATFPFDARFLNDSWSMSVMSYFSPTQNTYFRDLGFTKSYVGTPMQADILAMSKLYGLSTTTRLGDTVYGFHSNAGNAIYDANVYPTIAYTVFDSGGTDTLDFSGFGNSQSIDLRAGSFSNVGGKTGNVSIALGTVVENAIGGSGNDTINGNEAANVLVGNGGADTIYGWGGDDTLDGGSGDDTLDGGAGKDQITGGEGFDFAAYLSSTGITADLQFTSQNLGDAAGDRYVSIEGLQGGPSRDNLRGDDGANTLYGNGGDDVLYGRGGDDNLFGGAGNDFLYGEDGSDSLYGGPGDDLLSGSAGNDYLNGGDGGDALNGDAGFDYALYSYAGGGVIADLQFPSSQNTGEALGDSYTGIEGLVGSNLNDSLRGDSGNNYLWGGAGDDVLFGRDGDDVLLGNLGNDVLYGGEGNDIFKFGVGDGHDIIGDMFAGNGPGDVIYLSRALGVANYVEVQAHATQVGANVVITFDDGSSIIVLNVQQFGLAIDDFMFY